MLGNFETSALIAEFKYRLRTGDKEAKDELEKFFSAGNQWNKGMQDYGIYDPVDLVIKMIKDEALALKEDEE